ncbi:MAG: hypothetical protein KGJ31_03690 [Patescibacteria group bacterium]|nr:hypothetical protein [Patescibacteria group bacterium]
MPSHSKKDKFFRVGMFFNCLSSETMKMLTDASSPEDIPPQYTERKSEDDRRISPQLLRAVRYLRTKYRSRVKYRFTLWAGGERGEGGFILSVRRTEKSDLAKKKAGGTIYFFGQKDGTIKVWRADRPEQFMQCNN